MGSVHRVTVGHDGSVGVREAIPPRREITLRGGSPRPAERERRRAATMARASECDCAWSPGALLFCEAISFSASFPACSAVESTNSRRFTTHHIRVGAVRSCGLRSAWEASHQIAISRQAVLPIPVGTPDLIRPRPTRGKTFGEAALPREGIATVDRSIELRKSGQECCHRATSPRSGTGTQSPKPRWRPAPITTGPATGSAKHSSTWE